MSGHTPGPWLNDGGAIVGPVGSGEDYEIPGDGGSRAFVATVERLDAPRAEANARLIAAVPDLLDALRTAVEAVSNLDASIQERTDAARVGLAAIAKATGSEVPA